jgi:serine protease Do
MVTVGEVESDKQAANRRSVPTEPKPAAAALAKNLGLTLSDLTDAQRSELKIKGGVRIEAVEGAAARAGLREGDVITTLANTEVATVKDVEAVLSRTDKSRNINVLVRRGE